MDAKPRLFEQVCNRLRTLHHSYRTEQQYLGWVRRFVLFHHKRHPAELGAPEVEAFLSHLAVDRKVSAPTQNEALAAILFMYRHVLETELPWLDSVVRAKPSRHLPVVLTVTEVRAVLGHLHGDYWLIASLLYGAGLRLLEALRLRIKDIEFEYRQIVVRDGKGSKDRVTVLPEGLMAPLREHLARVEQRHRVAVQNGHGGVDLPSAIERKYPNAYLAWGWQYVFPVRSPSRDPRTGSWRRHHILESTVQRQIAAVRTAGIAIYAHVMRKGAGAVRSPLD